MRTTVDIEDDVLLAAKEIAQQRGVTVGKVLSDLARLAMTRQAGTLPGMVFLYSRSKKMQVL